MLYSLNIQFSFVSDMSIQLGGKELELQYQSDSSGALINLKSLRKLLTSQGVGGEFMSPRQRAREDSVPEVPPLGKVQRSCPANAYINSFSQPLCTAETRIHKELLPPALAGAFEHDFQRDF
jgi:hypothetical protein